MCLLLLGFSDTDEVFIRDLIVSRDDPLMS